MKQQQQPGTDTLLLLHTLDNMGVEIRRGIFDSAGGLARIGDRYILFLPDTVSTSQEKELCLDAVKKMGSSSVHVSPRVRFLLGEDEWENGKGEMDG
jgi:hypothetical protein